MIAVSHDPDAGTLYWYFTEIIAGSTDGEGECDTTLLLDGEGQIVGVELVLDNSISDDDLTLALQHPHVRYNAETYTLAVLIAEVAEPQAQPIAEPAILDFDLVGMLQGAEIHPAKSFKLAKRLQRLAPFLIDTDEEEQDIGFGVQDSVQDQPEAIVEEQGVEENTPNLEPQTPDFPHPEPQTLNPTLRSGFVALVGKPNVGKSTLLNALLGEKVAITSPKPQTTRIPLRGILNRDDSQIIFVDTPGIHDPRTKLGAFMVDQARRAIPDADIICMVVDISEPPSRLDRKIADLVRKARAPKLLVLNKVDIRTAKGQDHLTAYRELGPWDTELAVSATNAQGLETLVDELIRRLPEGGQLYPGTQRTDTSDRERAAELVREQVLRQTEQEVPHSVAIETEEWEDKGSALYIRMSIYVEKDSQKAIIIGAKGARLKEIGSRARTGIERVLGKQVYLDLWVKTRTNWRDDPSSLRWLGYTDKA